MKKNNSKIKIKYHKWRFFHKFMIIAFIFALVHVIYISSDISRDVFLKSYILFFSMIGLASGFYRSFVRVLFNKDYSYIVKNVSMLNANIIEIEVEPRDEIITFTPGQFIFIKFIYYFP